MEDTQAEEPQDKRQRRDVNVAEHVPEWEYCLKVEQFKELYKPNVKMVYLTGRATRKELKWKDLDASGKVEMLRAMKAEWDKWQSFEACKFVSDKEFQELKKNGQGYVVDTRC